MVMSVERCFSTFYDSHVGRISIHLNDTGVMTADIINLSEEPGCKRINIMYPADTISAYDAICHVLQRLTDEYGHTEDCIYEFHDCVWDSLLQKEVEWSKETVGFLVPVKTPLMKTSLLGRLDHDGKLIIQATV